MKTIYTRQLKDSVGALLENGREPMYSGKMLSEDTVDGVTYIAIRWQGQGIATYRVVEVRPSSTVNGHIWEVEQIHFGL